MDCPPCEAPKAVRLRCGHEVSMPCHRDPEEHECEVSSKHRKTHISAV